MLFPASFMPTTTSVDPRFVASHAPIPMSQISEMQIPVCTAMTTCEVLVFDGRYLV